MSAAGWHRSGDGWPSGARTSLMRLFVAILMACATAALGACSSGEPPPNPSPSGTVAAVCNRVMNALPATLAGQTPVPPARSYSQSWGDPAITVRCGVDPPAELGPTSRCDVINGVGWFSVDGRKSYRFTTIGRLGFIDVTVPHVYAPEGDVLVDLTDAVSLMPEVKPCQ